MGFVMLALSLLLLGIVLSHKHCPRMRFQMLSILRIRLLRVLVIVLQTSRTRKHVGNL